MSKSNKVLIGPSSFAETDQTALNRLKSARLEIIPNPFKRKLTKPEVQKLLTPDVVGLIAGLEPLDRDVLSASQLKVVSRLGAGLDNVDLKAAESLGISVCYTPDAPTSAVAELTLGALLSLIRFIPRSDQKMHDKKWERTIGTQLEGKTVLIIGFGRVGKRFSELLQPFRVNVAVFDPYLKNSISFERETQLAKALARADIVSIHVNSPECVIGAGELSAMKPGAILLNASRGNSVDEQALVAALKQKKLGGVWLDVFSQEPYAGPLSEFPEVLLTPHIGSYTKECRKQMEIEAVENLIAALERAGVCHEI